MNETLVFAAVGIALLGLLIGYLIASGVARSRAARAAEMTEANTRLLKQKVDDRDRELTALRSQVATLTADKTVIDEQEKAAEQAQDEARTNAQAALAAMEDQLNAALAEKLAADADRADLRDALALTNAEIATLSTELDDAAAVRRQLDEAQQKLNTQLRKVSEQLADEQARRSQEHEDAESTIKAFLLSARAATQVNDQIDYATTNADLLETSEPDAVRRAFRALAAVKSQADSELEVRHAELLDAEGKISSMRYSLNILSAAGAGFATSYASLNPQSTQQAEAISAATLAELDLLHMRIDALQSSLDTASAEKTAIETQMQERTALLAGLKARIGEALVALQPVIAEGESDELAAAEQEQAEQEIDEPVDPAEADDLAALDGSMNAAETDSEVQPELELQGDAPVIAAQDAGSNEPTSISALPEADRLAAGIATVLAVFGRKNGALSELRSSLDAETDEKQRLAADLQAHLAEFDGIQVRLGELSSELEGVLPAPEPQSEASATDAPDDTTAQSAPRDEAPAAVEETSAPEADATPAGEVEPVQTLSTVDRLALGVAGVIAALRGKDADLGNLHGEVDALTAARSAAEDELHQNQAELADVTGQLSGWIDHLRTRFADDPDVLAMLNASTSEGSTEAETAPEAGQEAAPDAEQTSEPIVAEQAEPVEKIADTAAPVAALGLLGMGIAAVGAAFDKKDGSLAELSLLKAQLEESVQQRDSALTDLADRIATVQSDLQGVTGDSPELAAVFTAPVVAEETPADAAATEPSPTGEQEGEQAAPVEGEAATPEADASPVKRALAGLAVVSTGVVALGGALRSRNDSLTQLQGNVDELTAAKAELESNLQQRDAALGDLAERITTVQSDLQGVAGDAPEVAALFAAPVAAEGAPAETAPTGEQAVPVESEAAAPEADASPVKRALAGLAVVSTGVAALGGALRSRNDSLTQLQGNVDELTAAKAELESGLQQQTGELTDLADRITAVQSDLQGVAGDAPELAAIFAAPVAAEEAPAEAATTETAPTGEQAVPVEGEEAASEADASPVKRALAGLAVVSTTVAALGGALRSRNDSLTQLQGNVDELSAAKSELESGLQQQTGELTEIADRITAVQSDLQGVAVGIPALEAIFAAPTAEEGAVQAAEPATTDAQEAEGVAVLSPAARALAGLGVLAGGVGAFGAALRDKDDTAAKLQESLAAMTVTQTDLQARLDLAGVNIGTLRDRVAALADDFQATMAGDADYAAVLQPQTDAADSDAVTPDAVAPEAVAPDAVAPDAPSVDAAVPADPTSEATTEAEAQPLAETLAKLAAVSASVAAIGGVLRTKDQRASELTGKLDELTSAEAALTNSLGQAEVELGQIDEQIAAWRTDLQAAVAGDADLEAQLQPSADQPEAAGRLGLLAAGVVVSKEALQRRADAISQLQGSMDETVLAKTQLEESLAASDAELSELRAKIAATREALRAAVADDDELAALFDEQPAQPAAEGDVDDATRATGVQLAPVVSSSSELDASTAAALAAFAKKNDAISRLQADFGDLSANNAQLEEGLHERDDQLTDLNSRIADWHTQLQTTLADDPDALSVLTPAEGGDAAEGSQPSGALLLGASAAAVGAALVKKNSALDDANSQIAALEVTVEEKTQALAAAEAQVAELQSSLEANATELSALNEQVASLQGELDAAVAAKAELEQQLAESEAELNETMDAIGGLGDNLRSAVGGELEIGETADDDQAPSEQTSRARRLAKVGVLTASVAAVSAAINSKNEELTQANNKLAEVDQQMASIVSTQEASDAAQQEKDATLADLQTQLAAAGEQVTQLQAQLDETLGIKTQLEGDLQQRQADLDGLLSQIAAVQAEMQAGLDEDEDLKTSFASRSAAPPELEAAIGAEGEETPLVVKVAGVGMLTAGVAATMDAIRKKNSDLSDANSRLLAVEAQMNALVADKGALETSIQDKDQALANAQGVAAELQASLDGRDADLASLNTLKEQLDTELAQTKSDSEQMLAEKGAEIESLNTRLAELQAEMESTQLVKAQLETDVQAKLDELAQLQQELAQTKETADNDIAAKVAEIATLTAAAAVAATTIKQKNDELDAANTQIATLQQQMSEAQAAQERLNATVQQKDKTIDAGLEQVESLQGRLAQRNNEITRLQDENSDLQAETRKLKRQIDDLQDDLEQEERGGGRGRVIGAAAVGAVAGGAVARRNQPDAEADPSTAQLTEMQRQMAAMQAQLAAMSVVTPAAGQPEATASRGAEVTSVDAVVAEVAQPEVEAVGATEEAVADTGIAEAVEEAVADTEIAEAVEEAVADTEIAEAAEEAVADTEIAEAVEEAAATESRMAEIAVLAAAVESADSATESVTEAEADAPAAETEIPEIAEAVESGVEATATGLDADLATVAAAAIAVEALSEAEEAPADESTDAADAQAAADVEVRVASVLQDLARVHGIGAVLEQRLYQAGIGTFWELATASKDELESALALTGLAREGTDLDALQADAARLAQETNSVGLTWDRSNVDDFKLLPKLGDTYKRRLYEAGLINYEAIANSTPEDLAGICKASKINPPDFEEWVLLAMEIVEKRAAGKE